jgi:hypothetical protein
MVEAQEVLLVQHRLGRHVPLGGEWDGQEHRGGDDGTDHEGPTLAARHPGPHHQEQEQHEWLERHGGSPEPAGRAPAAVFGHEHGVDGAAEGEHVLGVPPERDHEEHHRGLTAEEHAAAGAMHAQLFRHGVECQETEGAEEEHGPPEDVPGARMGHPPGVE